jgi:hypothetical protein
VKRGLFAFGMLALLTVPETAVARVFEVSTADDLRTIEDAPLLDFYLQDEMAQQQPPVVPPAAPVEKAPEQLPAATDEPAPDMPVEPVLPPATGEEKTQMPTEGAGSEDDFSLGDIPIVETVELSADVARKALDTYVLVREKYKDAALENFENLQDFVDQTPQGKLFEADVKAAGFADVNAWNTTITTLSFAYDNSIEDQTADIQQQISELQADVEMAQDMRERMITALKAMIPSDNNKKVLAELKLDAAYADKLKLLESEAE